MKCPNCLAEIHPSWESTYILSAPPAASLFAKHQICPGCKKPIVELMWAEPSTSARGVIPERVHSTSLVLPKGSTRPNPPTEVPSEYSEDYLEAALILSDSPKASAALSRRCLQHLLRTVGGVKSQDLAKEIDEIISSGKLPTHLSEAIDAIRNIGNFAAHPIKSQASGSILPVEPGEAEWTLDVLDGLFDFFFVQPELLKQRRAALNAKLASANKPPMK